MKNSYIITDCNVKIINGKQLLYCHSAKYLGWYMEMYEVCHHLPRGEFECS